MDFNALITYFLGMPWETLALLVAFVVIPTAALAVMFGIAWPLVRYGRKNWDKWKREPNSLRTLFYMGLAAAIIGIGVVFLVLDWLVALGPCSVVFREMPDGDFRIGGVRLPWLQLLTTRIQGYLNKWSSDVRRMQRVKSAKIRFNWYQRLYIRIVVRIANAIDRSPHFRVPANIRKVVNIF